SCADFFRFFGKCWVNGTRVHQIDGRNIGFIELVSIICELIGGRSRKDLAFRSGYASGVIIVRFLAAWLVLQENIVVFVEGIEVFIAQFCGNWVRSCLLLVCRCVGCFIHVNKLSIYHLVIIQRRVFVGSIGIGGFDLVDHFPVDGFCRFSILLFSIDGVIFRLDTSSSARHGLLFRLISGLGLWCIRCGGICSNGVSIGLIICAVSVFLSLLAGFDARSFS